MLVLLDLDPNVVKPGWIPLVITIGLGVIIALLFVSMRKQFRNIDVSQSQPGVSDPQAAGPRAAEPYAAEDVTPTDHTSSSRPAS